MFLAEVKQLTLKPDLAINGCLAWAPDLVCLATHAALRSRACDERFCRIHEMFLDQVVVFALQVLRGFRGVVPRAIAIELAA